MRVTTLPLLSMPRSPSMPSAPRPLVSYSPISRCRRLMKWRRLRAIPRECIIVGGQATGDSAVQAMREGAYDYVEKPLTADKLNRLKALIPKALDKFKGQQKNRGVASKLEGLTHFGELTGQSEEMRGVYQIIEAVAPSTASVLIFGESGPGKELVARGGPAT